jgi:hypothetical protein
MRDWKRLCFGAVAAAGLAAGAASPAAACMVSHPLPPEALARDAAAEGEAWADAPLVYVARVTEMGPRNDYFVLTPVTVLKGDANPGVVNRPPDPSRGMCLVYHGLNLEDGGAPGDEFVVYAFEVPPSADSRMRIVSTRMLGDPATRRAMEAAGQESGR